MREGNPLPGSVLLGGAENTHTGSFLVVRVVGVGVGVEGGGRGRKVVRVLVKVLL